MNYLQLIDSLFAWLRDQPAVCALHRLALLQLEGKLTVLGQAVPFTCELVPDKPGDDTLVLEIGPLPQWALRHLEQFVAGDKSCYGFDSWTDSEAAATRYARLYFGVEIQSDLLQLEACLEQLIALDGPTFEPARVDIIAWLARNS